MIIKNTTVINKEDIKGVVYASNCHDNRYKTKKLIFNGGGLLFGMIFVASLVPEMIYGKGSMPIIIGSGVLCGALLLIGMYGMDYRHIKNFSGTYGPYVGKTYMYEIDSEEIVISSRSGENVIIPWKDIERWQEDVNNFYLFLYNSKILIIKKKGFTECTAKDMKDLTMAIMYVRQEEVADGENANSEIASGEETNKTLK